MRVKFDDFEFDNQTGQLIRENTEIWLQPQPAKVLALLIARSGELVTRLEIQRHVWAEETHVDFEQGLNWCIRRIREVLDDSPTNSRFIQTVPRRGYRFLASTTSCDPVEIIKLPVVRPKYTHVAVGAGILLGVILGGLALGHHPPHSVTVLVLPFDNMSASRSGDRFEDIASKELMAKLARINPERLSVIDPLTARKFKNTKECIIKIGNQLGADYVLLGEVEPSANEIKVDAQLFKVSTNRQVWAAERSIRLDDQTSPIWDEMSSAIGAQVQEKTGIKN